MIAAVGRHREESGCTPGSLRRAVRGATLLEASAALALSAAVALSLLGGLRPLSCAVQLDASRSTLVDALLEARRTAYESGVAASVEAAVGAGELVLRPSGAARALGDGVTVATAPSDGKVTFRPTGLADNATVSISCAGQDASVVVNQRGVIR